MAFFLDNWKTVKQDFTKAIKNFFQNSSMLKEVNHTHLCLIPKEPNVERVEDYKPIALCNTSYKVIVKCLDKRLKVYLP